jgi:predicted metal-dependent peptidase
MQNLNQLLPTLSADIVKLSFRHVFFASIIMQMKRVAVKTGTAAIDGRTLWINPEFYNPLGAEERVSLLAHEADHVARLHPVRGIGLDHRTANIAMDQVINRDLRKCGYKLPEDGVHLDDSLDLTMEEWYARLMKKGIQNSAPQSGKSDEQGDGKSGDSSGQSGESGKSGKPDKKKKQDKSGEGAGADSPAQSGEQDGDADGGKAGAAGERSPISEEAGSGWGDVVEPQKGESGESPVTEAELKQIVSSALSVSRGTLPADYAQEIASSLQPVENWRALLAEFLTTQTTREDRSFRRENSRYGGSGLIMPVLHSDTSGAVAVCMDSSGSVDDARLAEFMAEIDSLRRELRVTVHHSHCDTRHSGWTVVTPADELPREVKNRGGTDFAPITEALAEADWDGEAPSCAVIFTDGECDSFGIDPSIPVLWMHAPHYKDRHFAPPFGRVVNMQKF